MKKYVVHAKDLNRGAKDEQKEHPWASPTRARRIARDHLVQYGPGYYRGGSDTGEKFAENINKKIGAKPIRRKPAPRPFNPLYDTPW
jgi:hypothetical protein